MLNQRIAAFASAAVLSLSLVACGSQSQTNETAEASKAETTQTESAEDKQAATETTTAVAIGDASAESTKIAVTNKLGEDITAFAMRPSGETTWGKNLLKQNEIIKKDSKVQLGIAADEQAESYDLQLKGTSGKQVEIKDVDLASMSELSLMAEGTKGYVTYKTVDGEEGTTKESASNDKKSTNEENESTSDSGTTTQSDNYTYEEPVVENYDDAAPAEAAPEPVVEAAPEPVVEAAPEPVVEAAPEQTADDCTRDNIILDV